MLRGPWMPSWSGLRRAAGRSLLRTRTLTTPRYQRWIKYFTGIFSLFPSFLIIPAPQMENQGIILYLNWSKNISPSLGSNSAPSNPGADYNWSVNIFSHFNISSAQNLGKIWKTLTDEQQAPFRKEAENLRYLHQLEYPDYKYRPKKRQRSGTEAAQQVNYTLYTRVHVYRVKTCFVLQVPTSAMAVVKQEPHEAELSPDSGVQELLMDDQCSPEKRFKFSEPGSPPTAWSFPGAPHTSPLSCLSPDYFSPGLTPPPKVPSSPDLVSAAPGSDKYQDILVLCSPFIAASVIFSERFKLFQQSLKVKCCSITTSTWSKLELSHW